MKPTLVQQYLVRLQLLGWVSHEWNQAAGACLEAVDQHDAGVDDVPTLKAVALVGGQP